LLGDGAGCGNRTLASIGCEKNLEGRRIMSRPNDFDRAGGSSQNCLRDAAQKEPANGTVTMRTDED
jgi:hypothetical protein